MCKIIAIANQKGVIDPEAFTLSYGQYLDKIAAGQITACFTARKSSGRMGETGIT